MTSKLENAPRIGMGCWAIGGPFWFGDIPVGYSGTDDIDSRAAINAALAAGTRVFDTSAVYGAGHSETLLGEELGDNPDVIIVTKFGHSFDAKTKQMTGPKFDADYIRNSVEQSRNRLKRDCLDIVLLHLNDLPRHDAHSVFDTLEDLRNKGQIDEFGWSTDRAQSLESFANLPGFTTVQHPMNVFTEATEMTQVAESSNIHQLIRSPLAMGVLTGKFNKRNRISGNDVRRNNREWQAYFTNGCLSPEFEIRLDAIQEMLTADHRTLAQGALCWLLAKSRRALPIPGAKNAEQAESNAKAMQFGPLEDNLMKEIEAELARIK